MPDQNLREFEEAYLDRVRDGLLESVPQPVRDSAVSYARTLIERGFPVIFDQQHLAHVTGVRSQTIGTIKRDPSRFYSSFRIAKRSGGSRVIQSPTAELKKIQHWIQRNVTSHLAVHEAAHGFARQRSIMTNAEPHISASTILKLDIRDFFGSVQRSKVYRAFRFAGYSRTVADLFSVLTTLGDVLPQGAPTSPDLANVAAYRLDVRLAAFAKKNELRYTRYADDLTFSGSRFLPFEQRTIEHIMRGERFAPNEKKVRYLFPSAQQNVTGIVVNEKLNWPRARRRWIRQEVYYLTKFGLDEHLSRRGAAEHGRYKEFIYGHLFALRAVSPQEAEPLLRALDAIEWPY